MYKYYKLWFARFSICKIIYFWINYYSLEDVFLVQEDVPHVEKELHVALLTGSEGVIND